MPRNSRGHVSVSKSFYVCGPSSRRNHFLALRNQLGVTELLLSKLLSRITLPRHRSTSSSSTPPTITDTTNASAPVQESYPVPSQQAFNSQFQHARNVDIRAGGQFTAESGPRMVTHLTINMPRMVWLNLSSTSNSFCFRTRKRRPTSGANCTTNFDFASGMRPSGHSKVD